MWAEQDSNLRPVRYKLTALTNWAIGSLYAQSHKSVFQIISLQVNILINQKRRSNWTPFFELLYWIREVLSQPYREWRRWLQLQVLLRYRCCQLPGGFVQLELAQRPVQLGYRSHYLHCYLSGSVFQKRCLHRCDCCRYSQRWCYRFGYNWLPLQQQLVVGFEPRLLGLVRPRYIGYCHRLSHSSKVLRHSGCYYRCDLLDSRCLCYSCCHKQ